ncbi:MAG TPA: isoaspartyl peptidase/L-asparaginase [Candidatus Thermoplasmatota archaeon]|nr:isoaspartyl peptidase/L-asparaginase [Candidatus Thermoplasmatota archaeon]
MAVFVAHGGATAGSLNVGGTQAAVAAGHAALQAGASLLDATVEACRVLEDDGGYNAGRGSHLRLDGQTVEMDAACMTGDGKFGAVVCVSDIRNPILAARRVHDTPHSVLVGVGATRFAQRLGLPPREAPSRGAVRHALEARQLLARKGYAAETGWRLDRILGHWNYDGPPPADLRESDTGGVVATDGAAFAAAASTGASASPSWAAPATSACSAPASTPDPQGRWRARAAASPSCAPCSAAAYERLATGESAQKAIAATLGQVEADVAVGAIAVTKDGSGAGSNCDMPWSVE